MSNADSATHGAARAGGMGFAGLNVLASDLGSDLGRPTSSPGPKPRLDNSAFFLKKSNLSPRHKEELIATRVERNEVEINGTLLCLDPTELRYGDLCFPLAEVIGVRWGKSRADGTGDVLRYAVHISRAGGEVLNIAWDAPALDDEQSVRFKRVVFGLNKFLAPVLIKLFKSRISENKVVSIGAARCTREGVTLTIKGMFGPKDVTCPWVRIKSEISDGTITIADRLNSKFTLTLNSSEIDNAFMLHNMDLS